MAITEEESNNLSTLGDAFAEDAVALVEVQDKQGNRVVCLSVIIRDGGDVRIYPMARMMDDIEMLDLVPPGGAELRHDRAKH